MSRLTVSSQCCLASELVCTQSRSCHPNHRPVRRAWRLLDDMDLTMNERPDRHMFCRQIAYGEQQSLRTGYIRQAKRWGSIDVNETLGQYRRGSICMQVGVGGRQKEWIRARTGGETDRDTEGRVEVVVVPRDRKLESCLTRSDPCCRKARSSSILLVLGRGFISVMLPIEGGSTNGGRVFTLSLSGRRVVGGALRVIGVCSCWLRGAPLPDPCPFVMSMITVKRAEYNHVSGSAKACIIDVSVKRRPNLRANC